MLASTVNRDVHSAAKATANITSDIKDVKEVLLQYALDPPEFLHLTEDWMADIIVEFRETKERTKCALYSKWVTGKLRGKKADVGERQKCLFQQLTRLEKSRPYIVNWAQNAFRDDDGKSKEEASEDDKATPWSGGTSDAEEGQREERQQTSDAVPSPSPAISSSSSSSSGYPPASYGEQASAASGPQQQRQPQQQHHHQQPPPSPGQPKQLTSLEEGELVRRKLSDFIDYLLGVTDDILQVLGYQSPDTLESHRNALQSAGSKISDIRANLAQIAAQNSKRHFVVVILGLEKAGKSTLINALIGFELLPVAIVRCTQVPTTLRPSSDPLLVEIFFCSEQEFQERLTEIAEENGGDLAPEQLQEKLDRISAHCRPYVNKPELLLTADTPKFREQLHSYIANELMLPVVRKAIISTNRLPADVPWELRDVPGLDSKIKRHRTFAIEEASSADAFIIASNGERPDFSAPALDAIRSIKKKQFDAMSRAFGVVTKLDMIDGREKFLQHLQLARERFEEQGVLPQNFFAVCATHALMKQEQEARKDGDDAFTALDSKLRATHPELLPAMEDFKFAIHYCVRHELPVQRLNLVLKLAHQHLLPELQKCLEIGRLIIPEYVNDEEHLKRQIERANAEEWGSIFENERWKPTLELAIGWKIHFMLFEEKDRVLELLAFYRKQMHAILQDVKFDAGRLEERMVSHVQNYRGWELDHRVVEEEHRLNLVERVHAVVDKMSHHLAGYFYSTYVERLVEKLNSICSEEPMIFQPKLTIEACRMEISTRLKRVANPILLATLRWAHDNPDKRRAATQQLLRTVPWIALLILHQGQDLAPQLAKQISEFLAFSDGLPGPIVTLLQRTFLGGLLRAEDARQNQ